MHGHVGPMHGHMDPMLGHVAPMRHAGLAALDGQHMHRAVDPLMTPGDMHACAIGGSAMRLASRRAIDRLGASIHTTN